MGLLCKAPATIGLLFTIERLTEGIVGLSLAGISDKLGRKKTTLIFLSLNLIA